MTDVLFLRSSSVLAPHVEILTAEDVAPADGAPEAICGIIVHRGHRPLTREDPFVYCKPRPAVEAMAVDARDRDKLEQLIEIVRIRPAPRDRRVYLARSDAPMFMAAAWVERNGAQLMLAQGWEKSLCLERLVTRRLQSWLANDAVRVWLPPSLDVP